MVNELIEKMGCVKLVSYTVVILVTVLCPMNKSTVTPPAFVDCHALSSTLIDFEPLN